MQRRLSAPRFAPLPCIFGLFPGTGDKIGPSRRERGRKIEKRGGKRGSEGQQKEARKAQRCSIRRVDCFFSFSRVSCSSSCNLSVRIRRLDTSPDDPKHVDAKARDRLWLTGSTVRRKKGETEAERWRFFFSVVRCCSRSRPSSFGAARCAPRNRKKKKKKKASPERLSSACPCRESDL